MRADQIRNTLNEVGESCEEQLMLAVINGLLIPKYAALQITLRYDRGLKLNTYDKVREEIMAQISMSNITNISGSNSKPSVLYSNAATYNQLQQPQPQLHFNTATSNQLQQPQQQYRYYQQPASTRPQLFLQRGSFRPTYRPRGLQTPLHLAQASKGIHKWRRKTQPCHNCLIRGHISSECNTPPSCYHCGSQGHFITNCSSYQNQYAPSQAAQL